MKSIRERLKELRALHPRKLPEQYEAENREYFRQFTKKLLITHGIALCVIIAVSYIVIRLAKL